MTDKKIIDQGNTRGYTPQPSKPPNTDQNSGYTPPGQGNISKPPKKI